MEVEMGVEVEVRYGVCPVLQQVREAEREKERELEKVRERARERKAEIVHATKETRAEGREEGREGVKEGETGVRTSRSLGMRMLAAACLAAPAPARVPVVQIRSSGATPPGQVGGPQRVRGIVRGCRAVFIDG